MCIDDQVGSGSDADTIAASAELLDCYCRIGWIGDVQYVFICSRLVLRSQVQLFFGYLQFPLDGLRWLLTTLG